MNHTRPWHATVLTGALTILATQVALAGPPAGALAPLPSLTLHFNDLNPSTPRGSKALYERIRSAASSVCRTEAAWYPTQRASFLDCYRATVDRTVARLNLPAVTAVHLASTQAQQQAKPALQAGIR